MRRSELYEALAATYGEALGSSLAADLCLQQVGGRSINVALDDGIDPSAVWSAFCDEMEASEEIRFYHRSLARERRSGRA